MIIAILVLAIMNAVWSIMVYITLFGRIEQAEEKINKNTDDGLSEALTLIYNMSAMKEQAEAANGYGVTYHIEAEDI